MIAQTQLQRAILIFESREGWLRRHVGAGLHVDYARALPPDREIIMMRDLIAESGLAVEIHELTTTSGTYLKKFLGDERRDFIFWNLSDGEQNYLGGLIPAFCQLFNWPYFGSRAYAQGLCQHKDHWKSVLQAANIPTPQWRSFSSRRLNSPDIGNTVSQVLLPHFIKPAHLGNSAGFADVYPLSASVGETTDKVRRLFELGIPEVIVEEYVDGAECTVGAIHLDHWELILFQQLYDGLFVDQPIKDVAQGRTLSQKEIHDETLANNALQIINVLGLKDYCRIDFRRDARGTYKAIDVNCTPFLTGWTFTSFSLSRGSSSADFYRGLLEKSFERQRKNQLIKGRRH